VRDVASAKTNQARAILEAEKKRILEELNQIKISGAHPMDERREGSPFGKREEEATESMELEKRLVLDKRLNNLLTEVERALQKMDEGSYGVCDTCHTAIDPARMEALPQAILCMSCRQKTKDAQIKSSST
jgi:DnaK suppressor protein